MSDSNLRLAIIGAGNMGSVHARCLADGHIKGASLAAICDPSPQRRDSFPGVPGFSTYEELLRSGSADAVLIATPHFDHTPIGIAALEAGLHVLVEKPISVHKRDCERLLAAHRDPTRVFAAMFNQRTDPRYRELRALLQSGRLGAVQRITWVITDWFRTQHYYNSGGWRATWAGEGGGVLLNQCPHQLDLWQWIFGRPSRIRAFCQIGRFHDIEVEDNVTAVMEYDDGCTGVFITTTGEAPGTNRLEVAADNGKVVIDTSQEGTSFTQNQIPASEFLRNSNQGFARPPVWDIRIPSYGNGGQHQEILQNFTDAVLKGTPLLAPASEGIHSVEMANAMLYSSFTGETVHLPLDSAAYEDFLKKKIASSTYCKPTPAVEGTTAGDFARSF